MEKNIQTMFIIYISARCEFNMKSKNLKKNTDKKCSLLFGSNFHL